MLNGSKILAGVLQALATGKRMRAVRRREAGIGPLY